MKDNLEIAKENVKDISNYMKIPKGDILIFIEKAKAHKKKCEKIVPKWRKKSDNFIGSNKDRDKLFKTIEAIKYYEKNKI